MKNYKLENLDCASCAQNLEYKLKKLAYVKNVSINFATSTLYIESDNISSLAQDIHRIDPNVKIIHNEILKNEINIESNPNALVHDIITTTKSNKDIRKNNKSKHNKKKKKHTNFSDDSLSGNNNIFHKSKVKKLLLRIGLGLVLFIPAILLDTITISEHSLYSFLTQYSFFNHLLGLRDNFLLNASLFNTFLQYIFTKENIIIFLFVMVYSITGYSVVLRSIKNILHGNFFDEQFLMTISTIGAFIIKAYSEAAGVMLFYVIGEYLLEKSLHTSRSKIKSLETFRSSIAYVEKNNQIIDTPLENVLPGDIVVIKNGERIPIDGIVTEGDSYIDASAITGESIPLHVNTKSSIFAGSINTSSLIKMKASKSYADSSISKIIDLVEQASKNKAKPELFITQFAKIYTPIIVFIAFLTAIVPPFLFFKGTFETWLYRAMILLVVSCPCALVLSIPLSYFVSLGTVSKKGILVKGSQYLDKIAKIKLFAFDKTGTLTYGSLLLDKIIPLNGYSTNDLLYYASAAELKSSHPIAISLHHYLNSITTDKIKRIGSDEISLFNEIPGRGISCVFKTKELIIGNDAMLHTKNIPHSVCYTESTVINVVYDNIHIGYITFSDQIKNEAFTMIDGLHKLGIKKLYMLTGDSEQTANHIAKTLSIENYKAQLMPEDKVSIIKDLKKQEMVAFVGDGINDAPILTASDVGISMGKHGTDIAIESSDIIITNDNLALIPKLIILSRYTRRIVMQNIIIALGIKVVFIVLGLLGVATMWEAVFGDVGVSLITLFNAMRLMKK